MPEGSEALLAPVEEALNEHNKYNIEANLPVFHHEFDSIQLPNYEAGEDYEVGYALENTHDCDLICEEGDLEDITEALEERIAEMDQELEALNAGIELMQEEEREDTDEYAELESQYEKLEAARDEQQEILDGWDSPESRYDELMWNTAWSENGSCNTSLARALGLDTLRFTNDERDGEEWFSLGGIGMDMSPLLAAYIIMEHGCCARDYTRHIDRKTNFQYFWDMVPRELAIDCLVKLDILDLCIHNEYFSADEIEKFKLKERTAQMDNSDTI